MNDDELAEPYGFHHPLFQDALGLNQDSHHRLLPTKLLNVLACERNSEHTPHY